MGVSLYTWPLSRVLYQNRSSSTNGDFIKIFYPSVGGENTDYMPHIFHYAFSFGYLMLILIALETMLILP
jgi:hypothetical protein